MYWVSEKEGSTDSDYGHGDSGIGSLGEAMQQYAKSTSKEGNYNDAANLLESKVAKQRESLSLKDALDGKGLQPKGSSAGTIITKVICL
jgi:hypothetical protein